MRKHIAIIIASLALFTGQAHAQRCLPKMQGIELRANLVDGMRLRKECKIGRAHV